MRRLARISITIGTIASLLASVAFCVLWARSYMGVDVIERLQPLPGSAGVGTSRNVCAAWARGQIRLSAGERDFYFRDRSHPPTAGDRPAMWSYGRIAPGYRYWDELTSRSVWNRVGFHRYHGGLMSSFMDEREEGIAFPAWLPAAVFAIPPILLARRGLRARRRVRQGLCRNCGYDLRASTERCPECGSKNTPGRHVVTRRPVEVHRS